MAAEGIPLMASAAIMALALAALTSALAITHKRVAYIRLGLISSLRRREGVLYISLTSALVIAVILASLSIGDGLKAKVSDNVSRNMSDVGMIVEYPDPIHPGDEALERLTEGGIHAALILEGSARSASASARIRVIGAKGTVRDLLPLDGADGEFPTGASAYINLKASDRLALSSGDSLELKLPLPHPRTIAGISSPSLTLDLPIARVVPDRGLGRFRTDSREEAPPIIILDLDHLSNVMGDPGIVNTFLCRSDLTEPDIVVAFNDAIGPGDLGYTVTDLGGASLIMNEDFMFPRPPFGDPVLAYFVDGIDSDGGSIPYSTMIGSDVPMMGVHVPPVGGAIISNETAFRLGIGPGDKFTIKARTLDPYGNLVPTEIDLTVTGILDVGTLYPLRVLVPPIAGITDRDSCSDWSPSFDVDLNRITDEDIDYWERYRTTPRVIMNFIEARDIFQTPYGSVTGVLVNASEEDAPDLLDRSLKVEDLHSGLTGGGGRIVKAREMALGSDRALSIFPLMFLTFGSTIIIGACLTLLGILRGRYLKRAGEWANARAIGLKRRGLGLVAVLDSVPALALGAGLGIPMGYLLALLLGLMLGGAWSGSVEGYDIPTVLDIDTALFSALSGTLLSGAIVLGISLREAARPPDHNARGEDLSIGDDRPVRFVIPTAGGILALSGIAMLVLTGSAGSNLAVSMLYVFGSAASASGIALLMISLLIVIRDPGPVYLLASANLRRRPGLAPLVTAILALTVAVSISLSSVGAGLEARIDSEAMDYGGGYDHIAELSVTNREAISDSISELSSRGYYASEIYAVGDEGGTCSNINAPYPPRLLGIPHDLRFDLIRWEGSDEEDIWSGLDEYQGSSVPILVDENTLTWIYYEDIGSLFSLTDEKGEEMTMVVVGVLSPSVLTGSFVMSRDLLLHHFPRSARPSILLVKDPPSGGSIDALREALEPLGPDLRSTLDLGRENMRYELGFLSIFNQFLIVGIGAGLISAASFTIARARERTTDIHLLHSMGLKKRRIGSALVLENMLSFTAAVSSALIVGISAAALSPAVDGMDPIRSLTVPLFIAGAVMFTAFIVSISGALIATSGDIRRRRDS
ncbi:MAG: hypothetical protein QCI82_05715 [Candidatus Thermoplasmatota archaeon]|nr:hypothetical protein [Candidatus Thermoplasmatota archaeon]